MAVKKIVKQITFQHKLVDVINEGTEHEEIMDLVPTNRVIVRYVEGEESELILDDALIETRDIDEPSVLIKQETMSSGNPDNVDLSTIGSQELLEQLLLNLENNLNQ